MKNILILFVLVTLNSCNIASVVTGTSETTLDSETFTSKKNVNLFDGLVVFYKMEEASNTSKVDSVSGNNLSDYYKLESIAGVKGNAVNCGNPLYQPSGPYLESMSGISFNSTNDYNISFWYKRNPPSVPVTQHRVFNFSGTYIQFQDDTTGQSHGLHWNFNATQGSVVEVLSSSDINNWVHVSINVDVSNSVIDIYKNSSLLYDDVALSFADDSAATFNICSASGGEFPPNAGIDSFGIWNRLLNEDEISALYNGNNNVD